MANVISRTREHERKDRAAAKRLEREARRLARRVSVPETAWAPQPAATCPSASTGRQGAAIGI
jgi:hypothetical protein